MVLKMYFPVYLSRKWLVATDSFDYKHYNVCDNTATPAAITAALYLRLSNE